MRNIHTINNDFKKSPDDYHHSMANSGNGIVAGKLWKSGAITLSIMLVIALFATPNLLAQKHIATMIDKDGNILSESEILENGGQTVHEDDSLALVAFYNSLNGDTWLDNSGWLVDGVEFWIGVNQVEEVEEGEPWRVTRFRTPDFPRYNMTEAGSLPPEFGDLEHLQRFRFRYNKLSGPIPPEIGKMTELRRFRTRGNYMSGAVPWDELVSLPHLQRFKIQYNYFTGEIPAAIGDFPSMLRLVLGGNDFEGEIPQEIANVSTLQRFEVQGLPNVTGPIPDLSALEDIGRLRFHFTNFDEGPIPNWLLDVSETVWELQLAGTNRTGSVPDWMADMVNLNKLSIGGGDDIGQDMNEFPDLSVLPDLAHLSISEGNFTGEIPGWLGNAGALTELYISDNDITGAIPGGVLLDLADNLEELKLSGLNITGGLPLEMQQLTNVRRLWIEDNPNLEIGDIPDWISNLDLSLLMIGGSGATGELPATLADLEELNNLSLRDSEISGDIPTWMSERNWEHLDLSRTNLNISEVPSWLAPKADEVPQLRVIRLAGLGLEGEIPAWLGDFLFRGNDQRMYEGEHGDGILNPAPEIDLSDNALTGSIPASLGNLDELHVLKLANNQLTGAIPEELTNMGRVGGLMVLQEFDVSGNPDLGTTEAEDWSPVPMGFTDAQYMRVFNFDGTHLCEPDDQAFDDWLASIPENTTMYYRTTSVQRTGVKCSDVVSVEDYQQPHVFRLGQNYPNPFNPATTIKYEIPANHHVTLHVYNVIGQRVATLVNEQQSAGSYEVNFDATRLSSGSYMYRLEAGDRSLTRTMMLIK